LIKGVNRQIIEIHDTGSSIFDKALLFVNCNSDISESKIKKEAKRILKNYDIYGIPDLKDYSKERRKIRLRNKIILSISVIAILISAIIVILSLFS
jgi:hypothetical protein